MVRYAGGISRFIPLRRANKDSSTDWVLDKKELECLLNSKTKIIIVNTPHNPFGKVYKKEELEHVADLCKKWNVLCIVGEVYEWIVYEHQDGHLARHVGKNNHCWFHWKNVRGYWMENGLGLWSCKPDGQSPDGPPKLHLHGRRTHTRSRSHRFRESDDYFEPKKLCI
ncbi:hypothetical protein MTP99_016981 [Tenebrio molitor]|nr:hypothetical protein MTP99_016981 [Tenebrio molitor]